MLFGKKAEYRFKLSTDGFHFERVLCITLGVIINHNFMWRQQIENTSKHMSKSVSTLNKVRYVIDRKALYNLYCTLVLPCMMYACEKWETSYNSRLARTICLEKTAIRIGGYRDH